MTGDTPFDVVRARIVDPETAWSLGTFGAIAEFMFDADEPVETDVGGDVVRAATGRGAARLVDSPDLVAVAYETPTRVRDRWSHAVALCLPAAAASGARRTVLTELGPDTDAVRPGDRDAILFDLGLGTLQADICVRSADPDVVALFREWTGRSLFEPGNPLGPLMPTLSPHRVFTGRLGRIEVFQPIPPADGTSPEGPHTHLLPKLLATGRTHAATVPLPEGLVPCTYIHPPNPLVDIMGRPRKFDAAAFVAFQDLLRRFGVPELASLKARLLAALEAGADIDRSELPGGRHITACYEVALRQHARMRGEPSSAGLTRRSAR